MTDQSDLLQRADAWVDVYDNADHLRRTVDWLRVLEPNASLAVLLAGLTHDMERAYPGSDRIDFDARQGPADPAYCRQHGERSARYVSAWLREQGAPEDFIAQVAALVATHEFGGWPEADLLHAADSISYLEINVDLLLRWLPNRTCYVGPADARAKIHDTFDRINYPRGQDLARRFRDRGLERVEEWVTKNEGPAVERR
jgi:hypothetical protein